MKTVKAEGVKVIPGDEIVSRLPAGTVFQIEDGKIVIILPEGKRERLTEGDRVIVEFEIGPFRRSNGERKG